MKFRFTCIHFFIFAALPSSFFLSFQRCNHFSFFFLSFRICLEIFVIFGVSFFFVVVVVIVVICTQNHLCLCVCVLAFALLILFFYSLFLIFHCRFKRFSVEFLIAVPFEDFLVFLSVMGMLHTCSNYFYFFSTDNFRLHQV